MVVDISQQTVPYPVYAREIARRIQAERMLAEAHPFIAWENALFANPDFEAIDKLLIREQRLVELTRKPQVVKGETRWRLDVEETAGKIGASPSTVTRRTQRLAENKVMIREELPHVTQRGEEITLVWSKLSDAVQEPGSMKPEAPRNHGGTRPKDKCQTCGGDLKIESKAIVTQEIVTCPTCKTTRGLMPHVEAHGHGLEIVEKSGTIMIRKALPMQLAKEEINDNRATIQPQPMQVAKLEVNLDSPANSPADKTLLMQVAKVELTDESQKLACLTHPSRDKQVASLKANSEAQFVPDFRSAKVTLFSEAEEETPALSPQETFEQAAALLVEIGGDEPMHAVMNRLDKKGKHQKYGPVWRPFSLGDAREHLRGETTRAARIRHQDGTTRALCIDADNAEEWARLEDAAPLLHCAGYHPLLEAAPACSLHPGGGHMWIIYDGLVDARCAWKHVCEIAPMLATVKEYWPASKQNVRLPGGVYVTPDASEQCTLSDVLGLVADKRKDIAAALLTYQTPAAIVPVYPPDPEPEPKKPSPRATIVQPAGPVTGAEISFTPDQLAAWFNGRNRCEDILPPAERGALPRAFPTWREHGPEPNVVMYPKTNTWCDFGDGQRGGDALELYVLAAGRDKKEIMRELGREYRAYLLDQAQHQTVKPEKPVEAQSDGQAGVSALKTSETLFAEIESTPAPMAEPTTIYDGPYAPPDRASLCCDSRDWQWNASAQKYECGACHPREARHNHAA